MPQTLMPIALPHGLVGPRTASLSVYFGPRTRGSTQLGLTDWLDWPSVVASLDLTIVVDGNPVPPGLVTVTSPPPDSAVWEAVFDPEMAWHDWVVDDRRNRPYLTLPERELHDDIVTAYAEVGNTFTTTIPTVDDLRGLPSVVDLLAAGGAARDRLAQARRFTARLAGTPSPPDSQGVEDLDVDQALALLARHPHLLRVLGLVVDLEIAVPAAFTWVAASTDIMTRPGNTVRELAPRTLVGPDFWSHDGFDHLADDALLQVDVLAAAGRLSEFVRTFADTSGPAPLPSLDDAGLALTRSDAVTVLHDRAERMARVERDIDRFRAGQLDVWQLHDDDVVVGRRIDAATPTGAFRSLHQRRCPDGYQFPRDASLKVHPPDDENWVSTMLGTEASSRATQQRARPVLHRWTGWSAAAPPPGLVLDPVTGAAVDVPTNEPHDGPVQFSAAYEVVPGTLPPLRYGVDYVLRARLVDISGVSRPVEDGGGRDQSPPQTTFGRWSAVSSPAVVRRTHAPVPGVDDTPTQLVIRSEVDQDDATVDPTDRLLFPPVGTQRLAERHGMPDGGASADAWEELATRDGRSLTDDTTADPVTGERIVVAGTAKPGTTPTGPTQVEVSYLPDPAGTGIGFAGVPGREDVVGVDWSGSWPASSTQRLVLAAGPPATSFVDDDDAVEVRLPKAGTIDVELACRVGAPFHDHFGVIAPMRADRSPAGSATLDRDLSAGRVWLVSARRTITLVHAVRVPLDAPAVVSLTAERTLGGGHARLVGKIAADRASTRRVTLRGTWVDPVDDPAEDEPRDVAARAILAKVPVAVDDDLGTELVGVDRMPWRLGDTRHREVTVTAEAYSRFSRHFTEQVEVVLDQAPVVVDPRGLVPSSVLVRTGDTTWDEGSDYLVDAAAGSVTRRDRGGIPEGTAVTVRFIPLPTSRTSDEHPQPAHLLDVANTLAPPPPDVLEVVPAFERRRDRRPRRERAHHVGTVVRVWVGRGWFASGVGELLGVVVDPPGDDLPALSAFGRDPVFRTADPNRLDVDALSAASLVRRGLVAQDGRTVDVAGHVVTFDPVTGRWFADLHLDDPGVSMPFLRLTLARFQPDSVDGAHLSTLVVADPVRLGPTRTSAVRLDDDGGLAVSVRGLDHRGVVDPDDDAIRHHDRITAWLERRDPGVADEALGWVVVDAPIVLTRVRRRGGTRWTTSMPVPAHQDGDVFRIRLEEEEPLQTGSALRPRVAWRGVFVETVPLPRAALASAKAGAPG